MVHIFHIYVESMIEAAHTNTYELLGATTRNGALLDVFFRGANAMR